MREATTADPAEAYRGDWRAAGSDTPIRADSGLTQPGKPDVPTEQSSPIIQSSDRQVVRTTDLPQHLSVLANAPAREARFAANENAAPRSVHTQALLAADVYNDVAAPPPGTRVADASDLQRLGLTSEMLEQPGESGFRARVYVSGEPGQEQYTVAFRGSQEGSDWLANAQQALGQESVHYANALEIGRKLARSDADVVMVGHSLGGGLAADAAIAAGTPATTFNAAGLHQTTIEQATAVAAANDRPPALVTNYRVPGEVLTGLQEGGDRVIGGALGGWLGGLGGGALGATLVDAPEAYGTQQDLPLVTPEGTPWYDAINPVDRHHMDWVLAGTAALEGR